MRGHRGIFKLSFAVVVEKAPGVISEVSLEQVQMAVKVVVTYPDAHPRLFHSVIAERNAADYALFAKGTVRWCQSARQTRRR